MPPPPLLLERHDKPEAFVELAKDIFHDTLMNLYAGVRIPRLKGVVERVTLEVTEMVQAGRFSDAALYARIEFAPWFFEMMIESDDFESHKQSTMLIGTMYFYELLFREAGL